MMRIRSTIAGLVLIPFGLALPVTSAQDARTPDAHDARSPYEIIPLQPVCEQRIVRPVSDDLLVGQILSGKGADQFRAKYSVEFETNNIKFDKQMLVFGITDIIYTRAFQLLRNRHLDDWYVLDYYNTGNYRRLPNPGKDKKYSIVQVFVTERRERMIGNLEVKNVSFAQQKVFAKASSQNASGKALEITKWDLVRYLKVGNVEEARHYKLQLKTEENKYSGHFLDKKVSGEVNESTFTGEVVRGKGAVLILRQDDEKDGAYAVVHVGHPIEWNRFRGKWYDTVGRSGEFEFRTSKHQADKAPPEPKLLATIFDTPGSYIFGLAVSPDGKTIATTASTNKSIKLWDVSAKKRVGSLTGNTKKLRDQATGKAILHHTGHTEAIDCVAFSPDGKTLASGSRDKTIRLWDVSNQWLKRTLKGHETMIGALAFSPDGKTLVSTDTQEIKLWDVATGESMAKLVGHKKNVLSIALAPDGRTLASGSSDGVVKLWNISTAKETLSFQAHRDTIASLAFSPDGSKLASGASGLPQDNLKLWNARTGENTGTLEGHWGSFGAATVVSVAFSPNGRMLASADSNENILLWDMGDMAEKKLIAALSGRNIQQVNCLAFTPDGNTLISTGLDGSPNVRFDGVIKFWDVSAMRDPKAIDRNKARRSNDGKDKSSISADEVSAETPYEVVMLKPLLEKRIVRPVTDGVLAGVILSEEQAKKFCAKYNVVLATNNVDFGKQMLVFGITDIIYTRAFQLLRNRRTGAYVLDYYNTGIYKDLPDPGKGKKYSVVQVFLTSRNEKMGSIGVKNFVFPEEKPVTKATR